MCMITYLAPGVMPDMARLRAGAEMNTDGHGYALIGPRGAVFMVAGNREAALELFRVARESSPDAHAVFHSRWITEGEPGLDNSQPFQVRAGGRVYAFAHNGTLFAGDGSRSDSRVFAEDQLPALLEAGGGAARREMERLAQKTGSRMLLIAPGDSRPVLAGEWIEAARGEWHSNADFLPVPAGLAREAGWARSMDHLAARKLHRRLAEEALGARTEAAALEIQKLRGELAATLPIHTGRPDLLRM